MRDKKRNVSPQRAKARVANLLAVGRCATSVVCSELNHCGKVFRIEGFKVVATADDDGVSSPSNSTRLNHRRSNGPY